MAIRDLVAGGEDSRKHRDLALRKEALVFRVIASMEAQNLEEFYAEYGLGLGLGEFAQERCPVGAPTGGRFTGPGGGNCRGGGAGNKRKSRTLKTVDSAPAKKVSDFASDHFSPKATSTDPDFPWGPPPFPDAADGRVWGEDYDAKGRSVPGSDDWLAAHGMDRSDYERDFHKENQGEMSDSSRAKLSDPDGKLYSPADKVMAQTDYIVMDRTKAPGSPFSDLTPELRPDNPVVLNNVERAKANNRLVRMRARLAEAEAMTPEQAVGVQGERVAARQLHLDRVSAVDSAGNPTYPGEIRAAAAARVSDAQAAYDSAKGAAVGGKRLSAAESKLENAKADMAKREAEAKSAKTPGRAAQLRRTGEKNLAAAQAEFDAAKKAKPDTGDPSLVADYKKELDRATRDAESAGVKADRFNQVRSVAEAGAALRTAERRLAARMEDPAAGLVDEQERARGAVAWAEDGVKKTAVKYAFLGGKRGVDADGLNLAARVGVPPDARNVRNLEFGNGRVLFIMEGELKATAAVAAARREDPDAAVVAVGSVTLWRNPETAWVAREHLRGREVVLIPDADGVTNPAVMREAFALRARLQNEGVSNVRIAAAPLDSREEIQRLRQTSGAPDDRKGLDDHLGLGGGTLGELQVRDRTVPSRRAFDLSKEWAANKRGAEGAIPGLYGNSREPTERALRAISALTGDAGSGRIGADTIADAAGIPRGDSTDRAIGRLEALGIIERHQAYTVDAVTQERYPALTPELERRFIREGVLSGRLQEGTFSDREEASIYVLKRPKLFSKEVTESPALSSVPVVRQKPDGQHNIATAEGAAYYSRLYGISLSVGDVLPEPEGVTASAFVRMVLERKKEIRNGRY